MSPQPEKRHVHLRRGGFGVGVILWVRELSVPRFQQGLNSASGGAELCFSGLGSRTTPCRNNRHGPFSQTQQSRLRPARGAEPMLALSQNSSGLGLGVLSWGRARQAGRSIRHKRVQMN